MFGTSGSGGWGGFGDYGRPGEGRNGKGLNGVYYDWSTGTYRRVENPSWEIDWYYVNQNIVQKFGITLHYGAYYDRIQDRNNENTKKSAALAKASCNITNRVYGAMANNVEETFTEVLPTEVPVPLKVLYAVLFTDPVAWSVELTGSTESGAAANATPFGGILITAGPDAGTLVGFSSTGVGIGSLSASLMITGMKYFYTGDSRNMNKHIFEGKGWSTSLSGGDGIDFGVSISWMENSKAKGDYLVGYGFGVGIGLPGISGQITWTYTKIW